MGALDENVRPPCCAMALTTCYGGTGVFMRGDNALELWVISLAARPTPDLLGFSWLAWGKAGCVKIHVLATRKPRSACGERLRCGYNRDVE